MGERSHPALSSIYAHRFTDDDLAFKRSSADLICRHVLDRFVETDATVLDLGAGTCEFTDAFKGRRKVAVDVRTDLKRFIGGVHAVVASCTSLPFRSSSADVIFASNLFEHLPSKSALHATLSECRRTIATDGSLIVLMPNIRYVGNRFWDYLDHETPLSHLSLSEALLAAGFEPVRVIPRFIPYTIKSRYVPRAPSLLRLYLGMPVLWRFFGKQMLVVSRPTQELPSNKGSTSGNSDGAVASRQ